MELDLMKLGEKIFIILHSTSKANTNFCSLLCSVCISQTIDLALKEKKEKGKDHYIQMSTDRPFRGVKSTSE